MEPITYTIAEATAVLRIGRTRLHRELASGRLPSFRIGKRRLISGDALRAYVREQTEAERAELAAAR